MAIGKTELAQKVAEQAGLNKAQANRAVDAVLETISNELSNGGEVRLTGFGNFRVTKTAARTGRNPRTGEAIQIPEGRRAAFTPGSRLKQSVGGGSEDGGES
jgi:DNA-binding protein HU-beta